MSLTALDLQHAATTRTAFYEQIVSMFVTAGGDFDVLALPTAQVWPFGVEQRWPAEVDGRAMDTDTGGWSARYMQRMRGSRDLDARRVLLGWFARGYSINWCAFGRR